MTWWLWIALGLVLAAIELATPGLFLIFFAAGALVVGGLALADMVVQPWLQWLIFPAVAIVTLRLFRQPLVGLLEARDSGEVDSIVGELATPAVDIPAGGHGRAELRGTTWNARNVASVPVSAGQRCRVVHVQDLLLDIRPE